MLFLPSEIPELRQSGSQRNPALKAEGIRNNVPFLILRENLLLLKKKKKKKKTLFTVCLSHAHIF